MYDKATLLTTDYKKAKDLRELYRRSSLNSYEFAKKYFKEHPYRVVKNTIDFARDIEFGFPVIIREIHEPNLIKRKVGN